MQFSLFLVAISCFVFCTAKEIKNDKLEKTKQMFQNILDPNEIEEITSRLQKLKSLRKYDLKSSSPSISAKNVATKPVVKNGENIADFGLQPYEINEMLGLDDVLYGGDLLLTKEQLDHLITVAEEEEKFQKSGREKRQAINDNGFYHIFNKTKPIFYTFDQSFANDSYRQMFREAMDYISAHTCLNIREGFGQGLEQQVHILSSSGCWSALGYTNSLNGQQLSIGAGCKRFSTMCHEMGHALGFHHTQKRHDRDNYIRLTMNSSNPAYEQYRKVTEDENNNFGLPYDLGSVMHYGSTPPNGPMQALDETKKNSIGASDKMVFSDFKMMNALYNCQESCPSSPACKNQGFRNPKNCSTCICPSGFQGDDCSIPQFNEGTNGTCGGILIAQSNLQTFTGSLNSYANFLDMQNLSTCYWHIQAPEGKSVRVKFNSYGGSAFTAPCYNFGLEVRVGSFETIGARVCLPSMVNTSLEYVAPSNLAIVSAFTKYYEINFSFSFWFVDP